MAKDFSQMAHYLTKQAQKEPEEIQETAESITETAQAAEDPQEKEQTQEEKAADQAPAEAPEGVAVMLTQEQLNAMIKQAQKEAREEVAAKYAGEQARLEHIEQTLETRRTKRFATMLRPVLYEILEEESKGLPGGPSGLANQILEEHYALKINEKVSAALAEYEKMYPEEGRKERRRLSFVTHTDYMTGSKKK